MRVHILLNNLTSPPLQHEHYFWHRSSKCYEIENFILRYLSLKFPCGQIIKTIGLILRGNMFGVTNVLISEYVRKSKWVDT